MFGFDLIFHFFATLFTAVWVAGRWKRQSAPVAVEASAPNLGVNNTARNDATLKTPEVAIEPGGTQDNQERAKETSTLTRENGEERNTLPHPEAPMDEVAIEPGGTVPHGNQEGAQETREVTRQNDEQENTLPLPGSPTHTSIALNGFSTVFYDGYHQLGDIDHLEKAIKIAQEALDIANLPAIQSNLSRCLGSRYERRGNLADLARALELGNQAVRGTVTGDSSLAERLGNLGHLYHARYQQLDDKDDLERAIENANAALEASILPEGDFYYAYYAVYIWSSCMVARFERTEFTKDDGEATASKFRDKLSVLSPDCLNPAVCVDYEKVMKFAHYYSICLTNYHILGGPASHLETAIRLSESYTIPVIEGSPKRAERLDDAVKLYYLRHDMNGNIPDLEKCLEYANAAVVETPADHILLAARLNALSLSHCARFKRSADIEDLNLAISYASKVQETVPPEHPQTRKSLLNLCAALHMRYERFGNLHDLETAIQKAESALASAPDDDLGHRRGCLSSLAQQLGSRYDRFGALKDLEATIAYAEENLNVVLKGHMNPAGYVSNLAKRYSDRYKRLKQPVDLNTAIYYGRVALVGANKDHPYRPGILNNLAGYMLGVISVKSGTLDENEEALLDEVISHFQEAVSLTQDSDPELPIRLSNLAGALKKRGVRNVSFPDIMATIEHDEKALARTPHDHPERAVILTKIAYTILLRAKVLGSPSDERLAYSMYCEAWNCLSAHPLTRIDAARNAVMYLPSAGSWDESSSMLENAVRLMPQLSLVRSLERDDQEAILGELYGLSALAASSALEAGKEAAHALGLLEMGRGILSGSVMDTRTSDLDRLRSTHPHLWDQFTSLQRQLSGSLHKSPEPGPVALDKRKVWEEFERTLGTIREIHEYREFLLPSTSEVMRTAVHDGTVVVVNCTKIRSDAIIVTKSAITSISLPNLMYEDMKSEMSRLPGLLEGNVRTFASRNKALRGVLRWLWKVAVEEILNSLGLEVFPSRSKRKSSSSPPRIWWIGTGEMSIAPFHAAGIHTPGSTKNTISHVCSSYISTIKALGYARQRKFTLSSSNAAGKPKHKILLATMPTTPNHEPLLSVELEAFSVQKLVGHKLGLTVLSQPRASEILATLPEYDVAHFACHGVSDRKNPSKSSLVFVDSNNSDNPVADHLTVQEISSAHIERAQLAYLSACSTADNTATNLGDETVHLASAFQLAGFTHVVANLWQSKDDACMQVAGDFYSAVLDSEMGSDVGHGRVSLALHGAVVRLREKRPQCPLVWAPFIHTGA